MKARRVTVAGAALVGIVGTVGMTLVDAWGADHLKCYRARTSRFTRRTVDLVDQFGETTTSVISPTRFCNPADKNGEGIIDPTAHLICYRIKEGPFSRRTVLVRNQFGDQTLAVTKPESLCNPAEKDGIDSTLNVNHYKCYRVVGPGFTRRTVDVADQFETQTATLLVPRLLCNPVDKNGEGVVDPAAHLTCYTMAPGGPFTPRPISVVDQFAEQDLTALRGECRRRSLLCVPSEKNPGATTSSTSSSTSSSLVTTTSVSTTSSTSTTSTSSSSSTSSTSSTSTTSTSSSTSTSTTSSTSTTHTTSTSSTSSTSSSSTSSSTSTSTSDTTSTSSTSTTETTSSTTPGDTTTSTTEPAVAICGNNEVEPGELCDPPGGPCPCDIGPPGVCSDDCLRCLFCQS